MHMRDSLLVDWYQDIVEAIHLIIGVKDSLQDMRDNGWEPLLRKSKTIL
jgi:hypothetical protein